MFKKLFSKFSKELAIDMGTAYTRIFVREKGIVINEPSVVAINTRTDQVLSIGSESKKMLGKTPPHIEAAQPLVSGVISDFEIVEKMLKYFIDRIHKDEFNLFPRPNVVASIPIDVTEVERKAVEDVLYSAGANQVKMVESPMSAAIGARLPINEALGLMVVDIGAGKTEIAVISLGGIVISKSFRISGDELTKNIITYVREKFNLLLGDKMAETVKIEIGSCVPFEEEKTIEIRGRDIMTGLPKQMVITDRQVREAMQRSINLIIENIKAVLEMTPPELSADIYERGMVLCGGGSQLAGIDQAIYAATHVPVKVTDDPMLCVVRGNSIVMEDIQLQQQVCLLPTEQEQKIR